MEVRNHNPNVETGKVLRADRFRTVCSVSGLHRLKRCRRLKTNDEARVMPPILSRVIREAECRPEEAGIRNVQFLRINAPTTMPMLMASCWLTAIRLLPLPVCCGRKSARVSVFMAENCRELHAPIASERKIQIHSGEFPSGRASSMMKAASSLVFQSSTVR